MNYLDSLRDRIPGLREYSDEEILPNLPEYDPQRFGGRSMEEVRTLALQDNNVIADTGRLIASGAIEATSDIATGVEQLTGSDWQFDDDISQYGQEVYEGVDPAWRKDIESAGFNHDSNNTVAGITGTALKGVGSMGPYAAASVVPGGGALGAAARVAGTSGLMIGGGSYKGAKQAVEALSAEELQDSPIFQHKLSEAVELYGEVAGFDIAKDQFADMLASDAFREGLATGAISGALLGPSLSKLIRGGQGVVKGAQRGLVTEGAQEFAESGSQAYSRERAISRATGEEINTDQLLREAAFGATIGGVTGSAVGGATGLVMPAPREKRSALQLPKDADAATRAQASVDAGLQEIEDAQAAMAEAQAAASVEPAAEADSFVGPHFAPPVEDARFIGPVQRDMEPSELLRMQQKITAGRVKSGYGLMPSDEQLLADSTRLRGARSEKNKAKKRFESESRRESLLLPDLSQELPDIIYGTEPEYSRASREQREADHFNALYGQEGQTPYKAPAIEGELDRSNELPDKRFAMLPPGTGQIDLGRDRPERTFEPVDQLYDGVGRNIVERQAPRGSALTNEPLPSQEQVIDYLNEEGSVSGVQTASEVANEPTTDQKEQSNLIYRPNGEPYKTAKAAEFNQAFRNNAEAEVVAVKDGFAVQLKREEDGSPVGDSGLNTQSQAEPALPLSDVAAQENEPPGSETPIDADSQGLALEAEVSPATSLSKSDIDKLRANLRELYEGDWGHDGHRYQAFAKRLDSIEEGDQQHVGWAEEWLNDIDTQADSSADQQVAEEKNKQKEPDVKVVNAEAERQALSAGEIPPNVTEKYAAWVNSLSDNRRKELFNEAKSEARNAEYMAWATRHDSQGLPLTELSDSVPIFSRTGSGSGNNRAVFGVDAVRVATERIAKRLRLRGVKLSVVESEDLLPASLKAQIAADGAEGEVKAAYHDKAIHIVADRMSSVTDVEEAILHEGAHYGGRALFGKDMHTAYRKLWMRLGGVKGLRARAEETGFNMDHYIKTADDLIAKGEIGAGDRARFLVDEFLAHLNQQKAHERLPARIMRGLQEFFGSVRNALRKAKFAELPKLTDADLAYLLRKINKATQGEVKSDKPHFMRATKEDEMNFFFEDLAAEFDAPAMQRDEEAPTFSRAATTDDALTDEGTKGGREGIAQNFAIPDETLVSAGIRKIADKFKVLKDLQANIEKAGGTIDEAADAYMAEELFHGKAESDLRQMRETFVEPLAKKMADFGITQAQLDEYLYAKHAPERNAHVAEINPDMPDGGSGMTDQQAENILAKVKASGKQGKYNQVAAIVYDMLAARRDAIRKGGLEDDGMIDAWEDKYEHYVPLKGHAENEKQDVLPGTGKGFTIGGKESRRAMGRKSEAASPSSYAMQDLTETFIRSRKNEVGNAFLQLVEENPNPDYWQVFTEDNPETDRRIVKRKDESGESYEEVVEQAIPMAMMTDRYFTTKRDGKTHYIKLEDPRLMKAMKNIGPDTSNFLIQGLGRVNRFLSVVNTSYNPEFVVGNFQRDVQTAVLNLTAEQSRDDGKAKGEAIVKQVVKDIPKAMREIFRSLRGKDAKNGEWADWFEEFQKAGAKTGYYDMQDIDGQAATVRNLVAIANGGVKGNALKWAKGTAKFVEDVNQSVENAVRLSAYVNARKAGISQAKAASLAKNLTVNFNRRGEMGTTLNALYMFANASIQGTMNFGRTMLGLKGNKGDPVWKRLNTAQKISVGLMAGSYALAMVNRMAAGEDDDGENWYDKVPDYVKERNLVIMDSLFGGEPDGSYTKIPLPYGYNIFHVFGSTAEGVLNGNTSAGKGATDLALAALGSFSPIGFQDSDDVGVMALKNIMPTLGKPLVDIVANENFMGSSIYNENMPFGTPKPDSSLARRSTPEAYKVVAEFLNEVSGGSKWRSGAIDINPDVMRYVVGYFTGGAGNFAFNKVPTNAFNLYHGVEQPAHRWVFLSRMAGQVLPYEDQSRFYDHRMEIGQIESELKALRGAERYRFYRENKGKLALRALLKSTEKRLKFLRKHRDRIYIRDINPRLRDQRLKEIERRIGVTIDRFNKAYNRVK